MYAIVEIGSSQYRVSEGDTIAVDQLDQDAGSDMTFDKVVLLVNGKDIQVGQPHVKGAKIKAKVVDHHLGKKVITLRTKRRNQQQRRSAHRPHRTQLNITQIAA